MRVCIVGAGAIGAYIGGKLLRSGEEVTLIARGANLAALKQNGLTIIEADGSREQMQPTLVTDSMQEAGPHDLVIVAVKAQGLASVVEPMRALYHDQTAVLMAQNGIPWWYFHGVEGEFANRRIEAVDPDGTIERHLEVERVIGSIVYIASELVSPGVVRHVEHQRLTLGEPNGTKSERIQAISRMLIKAGFKAPVTTRIRNEIWVKLWGNMVFNPLSALTRATLIDMIQYPHTNRLARAMMAEGQAIGEKLGIQFGVDIETRLKGAEGVGAHKTSMLQDIEARRSTEIDALVGAVIELGRLTDTPTPHLDAIYATVKLMEKQLLQATEKTAS